MERESFEDKDIAALLNESYVPVKVDREERPDVDSVYMDACQTMTGNGGWPLTLLLTPDKKPFFAATYIPPYSKNGSYGLAELLENARRLWSDDRGTLVDNAEKLTNILQSSQSKQRTVPRAVDKALLEAASRDCISLYDSVCGGFGASPKFPEPHRLIFLMRYGIIVGNKKLTDIAYRTLDAMARGGIFDHVGGGFSRYSTDRSWLVPHFEKMLYDNALLAYAYTEAYIISGDDSYKSTAKRTLDYILRDMTNSEGGFYSAQDADSPEGEGAFYTFTPDEIISVLGDKDGKYFNKKYDLTATGNFDGKNIVNFKGGSKEEERDFPLFERLRVYRQTRMKLVTDDKILLSRNSLAIAAFAKYGAYTGDSKYTEVAKKAEFFCRTHLAEGGKLYVSWRDGVKGAPGKLDDYAFYSWALIELYRATFDAEYLLVACDTARNMLELFFDKENGGFWLYSSGDEELISRPKESFDYALPSGNSAAALVLSHLYSMTDRDEWRKALEKQFKWLYPFVESAPAYHGFALLSLLRKIYPAKRLICVQPSGEDINRLIKLSTKSPGLDIAVVTKDNARELDGVIPGVGSYDTEQTAFYLCTGSVCMSPEKKLAGKIIKECENWK